MSAEPGVDPGEVSALLADHYGLRGSLTRIATEKDDALKLAAADRDHFVKVSAFDEPQDAVDLQASMLAHLERHAPDLPVQRLLRTRTGEPYVRSTMAGEVRTLWVVEFVQGAPLAEVDPPPALLEETGRIHARLTRALAGFTHAAGDRRVVWDVKNFASLRDLVEWVPDAHHRRLAETVFDRFADEVTPHADGLERQFVHGDISPYNVIADSEGRRVAGVIDFGDAVRTPLIFDLSVPVANLLDARQDDPWASGMAHLRGYLAERALPPADVELLAVTAPARLTVRALFQAQRARTAPDRGEYLLAHGRLDWENIEAALAVPQGELRARLADLAARATPKDTHRMSEPSPSAATTMVNAFDPSNTGHLDPDLRSKIERRGRVLGPGYRLFYDEPVEVVRGQGAHLFDAEGNDYLDAYNNVPSVGHCHPRVVEAVSRQVGMLNTNTRYVQEALVEYAEQLVATFPAELSRVSFTCTGSEANDLATRVAMHRTGERGIIVTAGAYHGLTAQVAAFSPSLGEGAPLGPDVRLIAAPDALRVGGGDLGAYMREQVAAAVHDLRRHGYGLAAFFADSVFASDGVYSDPPGFLRPVIEEVHAAGGLYVADEVQPGFGRLGESWWGFERHGIVPDMVSLGKPMAAGLPLSGVVFRPEVAQEFGEQVRYFNTFGGNSVSIAAGQAVLDVIRDENLIASAHRLGGVLREGLSDLTADSDVIAEIRGSGLFIGVDIVTDRESLTPDGGRASRIVNALRRRRVLISGSGLKGNVLKVRPPLAVTDADCARFLEAFGEVLAEVSTPSAGAVS